MYDRNLDLYNSNRVLRNWFDYAMAKGVNWTPSIYINGVRLDKNPTSVYSWMNHL